MWENMGSSTLNEQGSGFSPQYQNWGGHPIRSEHIWKLTYVNTNTGRRNSKLLIIVFLFFFWYPPPPRNSWLLPLLSILVCPIGYAPQTHAISGKEKRKGQWEKKGPPSSLGTVSYELNPKSPAVHTGTFTSPHHFSHLLITACLNSLSAQWRHLTPTSRKWYLPRNKQMSVLLHCHPTPLRKDLIM